MIKSMSETKEKKKRTDFDINPLTPGGKKTTEGTFYSRRPNAELPILDYPSFRVVMSDYGCGRLAGYCFVCSG